MQNCLEYVQDSSDPDPSEAASAAFMAEGDGMSSTKPKGSNWSERLSAPFKFGMKELVPTLVKFGSALTVTAAGQRAIQQLGLQLIKKQLKYQVTAKAVTEMAKGAVATWSRQAVLETAQRGVTMATARYSIMQGALAFLGPIMWGSLALDLALKAIGTDYARIIRAVFILAQVRLVRTQGFVQATTIASSDIAVVP
ncbi:hypothetical protein CEUSTIGMA_g13058.t1 [Chlamydomonas eustigma]|uniref:Uncharacterized protein n=1 Tax=Chlamydomonas eustigma TaxID=1157962 RepID=A0A250XRK6_9CHLO|nr:hypothetical protein CEUSTIGMA_g13058.t1 [Chlamydomonas eustigma]|eukprot:GAX85643.1 hypothetical protein CEUSTIGMA_g13058.t1 [Chlamydomonas eustigma]